MCKLRSKDSDRLIDSHKKFVTGFTIIEVVVSTLIIVILAAGVFGAFLGTKQLLSRARHKVQAYNFAMEAVDKLRSNYSYEDPAMDITPPSHTDTDIGGGIIQGEMTSLGATIAYDVTETQPDGYKEVVISVHWDENIL